MRTLCIALAFFIAAPAALAAGLEEDVYALQLAWEQVKYRHPAAEQEAAFEQLAGMASQVRARHPERAEPEIWYGIIVASQAGAKGGLGALSLAKEAKRALEHAIAIDPEALEGSAYTSLGSLYYQVPGWPIGFGDKEKARELLQHALIVNPDGIDPNYFLGDFLYRKGDYAGAREALQHALKAPPRARRPLADEGRRREIESLLKEIRAKGG
ncbi:MAG TPA: tetratricopeptide repeat protein [Burkholderiales bacterium]|nr:tetratricopeptide repeat protein [Burkholderiales bacterium]